MSKTHFTLLGGAALSLGLLWGCASIGNPSGGPRDEDPPRFVRANPAPGSVNVDPSNINIEFNELINVKDAFEKVVLSPPGKSIPRVTTRGRRVVVNITDTLLPNTTYTIDFGDAIEDNNEGNKLSSFAYTFSTGPVLDSLRIAGMVLGAQDMEPQQGVFVGAYVAKEDSAFLKMPFQRLARTDEYGRFVIRGLQDTTYRLFALKDLDNDRHYANPEEDIAWFEDVIRPSAERIITHDTIRNLMTGAVDTVVERERTRFLPNNILLRMYNTGLKPQYLVSYTRPDSTRLEFIFNAPEESMPDISIVGAEGREALPRPEITVGNDTLTFWLPREIASRDTLRLALRYTSTDLMTGVPTIVNDTVRLIKPKAPVPKKNDKKKSKSKKKETEKIADADSGLDLDSIGNPIPKPDTDEEEATPPPPVPTFQFQAKGPDTDITMPLSIEAPVPLSRLDTMAFRLEIKPDTVWLPLKGDYRLQKADTLSERRFKIDFPWQRGVTYRVVADSLASTDIYGINSSKFEYEFKTKAEEDLSSLRLTLTGIDPDIPAYVELIVSGDKPKYAAPVVDGSAFFSGIDAGKYYARLYEDFNGDRKYSTGSYRLQHVFGSPLPKDSVSPTDSVTVTATTPVADISQPADTVIIAEGDSIAEIIRNSVEPASAYRRPLSDKEIVRDLLDSGYSLSPIETDSVGTDILIAIQPDYVYYYPKTINVKKNWDVEQTWNVFETALDLQKPDKLKKNKPKRKNNDRSSREEEEEEEDDDFMANPFAPDRKNSGNRNNSGNRRR